MKNRAEVTIFSQEVFVNITDMGIAFYHKWMFPFGRSRAANKLEQYSPLINTYMSVNTFTLSVYFMKPNLHYTS